MIWLDLLRRLWPYLATAALITGGGWYLHHSGYESGYADATVKWQVRFAASERELAVANARKERAEAESSRAVAESQRRIDETQKFLAVRLADADSRLRALSLRYTAAASRRCDVPAAPGASPVPDAATAGHERAERAGASIARVGGSCEWDASRLAACVRIYTEQRRIINQVGHSSRN